MPSTKLKPKLLFWDEVRKKGLRGNVCLIQTHWQLVWYFNFGLWIQSIILFSLAVKILQSIDNSWLGLPYQNLSSSPVNSSSHISFKRELPEDRLTTLICSKSVSFIIRPFNYCFSLWYQFLLQFLHFPWNVANHVQLVIKWKPASNIRNHSEGSENRVFLSHFENTQPDNINHRYFSELFNLDRFSKF